YDHYGIEEGDFDSFVEYHFNGTENTAELPGFFTGNDPSFSGISNLVTTLGGVVVLVEDPAPGSSVSGTAETDAYLIGDYHVNASPGSDLFIMGLGSSDQNSLGSIQNVTYDGTGAIDYDASDPNSDMDILFVSWLPDGVTVDANFGSVSHGSGGAGSDVYTDYFAGIEVFDLTDFDDYFAGGGPVDINWINPGSGNDTIFGVDSVFTVLDYSDEHSRGPAEAVFFYNGDISSGIPIPGETDPIMVENGDQFDGAVIDENGDIDVYTNVDYFVGSAEDDVFIGGSGSDQFNAMWSDDTADIFDGGAGDDTLIIEDSISNSSIFGDLIDASLGVGFNDIDLGSIEVIRTGSITDGFVYNVTGTNKHATYKNDIDVELTDVERIDIREYSEIAQDGSEQRELYVVDSYELLEGGQGDLGDMYYVTSLGHSPFDIDDGENSTYQILSEDNLNDANIYYSGHHTDFNRQLDVSGWTASGTAAAIYTATNLHQTWQGHEPIFFAWYDPDGEGGVDAYEIAVKRDDDDGIWRIANKAFDTFSNITLSAEDASTLNAMSHSIQENDSPGFAPGDTLRVYLGAAYQDITNVINSGETGYVGDWDFSQDFTTSRSTYYIEIPNGTTATTQQVKVEYNNETSNWELRANEEILVNIPAFSVIATDDPATTVDERASVVAGSGAAELISAGDGADTMLGGGGADTYRIGDGDASEDLAPDAFGVVGDVINEIGGDLSSTLGDSVNFTNLESIDNIFFDRTQIRYEEAESTLTMTSNTINGDGDITKDVVHIFDHFNEDLPFRQVEQLLLDEGWGLDQIWNLVADGQGGVNRDVLVGGSGDDTLVSGGGVDVMQGGLGQDIFVLGSSDVALADIDTAHGDVTMIRDFVAGEDDIDLSVLGITDREEVSVETEGGRDYLVHTYAEDGTATLLAEFTHSSDLTNFNKDEDIKVAPALDL
ncbi:hypothetical protein OA410_03680, partial [Paracoccaceae bacterium]|nr:hypothetical protein [Paracoccaceae bacterium]